MRKIQQGFTLIELMIVVAIIGILAAVAIPNYQQYTKKAKFTEVTQSTSARKTGVEVCAQDQNSVAGCVGGAFGVPADSTAATTYVASSATAANGVITSTATATGGLNGETIILTPALTANGVTWAKTGTCTNAPAIC